jgi:hypothetical protein
MLKKTLVAVAATLVALGASLSAYAAPVSNVINPNTLGAALAMPYLTTPFNGGTRMTVGSVTNGLDHSAVNLHIVWISATDWSEINYDCPLTPLETTYFVYEQVPGSDNALVTFECSNIGQEFPNNAATNNVVTRIVNGADGIMFVALECQIGQNCAPKCEHEGSLGECPMYGLPSGPEGIRRTRTDNALAGDLVVIDFGAGYAFSAPAIHIQGYKNLGGGGDRNYRFNGEPGEYKQFPSLLTTNYIAPDDSVSAELLLFTLDGKTSSSSGINAKVSGFAYDDDENPTSGSIAFDCMTVTAIDDSPNGFGLNVTRPFGGHLVGHLELFPAVVARSDEQELLSYSPEGVRRALVHGYIIQAIRAGGQFDGGEFGGTMAANGVWARQLTQGTNPLVPVDKDVPSLDARAADGQNQI